MPSPASSDAALRATLDAHGAALCAYAAAVTPGVEREVLGAAIEAARADLPAAGRAASSVPVVRAALHHHLRLAAARALGDSGDLDCRGMSEAIVGLANGQLDADQEADLRDHVADCPDCERMASRFATGERILAEPDGAPVALWLYEVAAASAPAARRAGGARAAAGARATPGGRPAAALAGIAALVAIIVLAVVASSLLRGGDDDQRIPAGTPTPVPTASPAATATSPPPAGADTTEQSDAELTARRQAAADRRIALEREGRALARQRSAARAASRRRDARIARERAAARAAARARNRATPTPIPTPTPTPTSTAPPAAAFTPPVNRTAPSAAKRPRATPAATPRPQAEPGDATRLDPPRPRGVEVNR